MDIKNLHIRRKWKVLGFCIITISGLFIYLTIDSFPTIEYYQMAFPVSQTTGYVWMDKVYFAGKHAMGPDIAFKTFRRSVHFEEFKLSSVSTADKLEIGMTTYFQYILRPHQLAALHEKFDKEYRPIIKSNALDALKNRAVYFTTREYIRQREMVEKAFKDSLSERLGGKCCEKDCGLPTTDPCEVNCTPYGDCVTEDWGLFSTLTNFQVTRITIPQELEERFTNALLLTEQNEEAKLRQESAVYRKETNQLVQQLDNEAGELQRNSVSNATLIKTLAVAEANQIVENARIEGLTQLYTSLGITNQTHQAAFDYLRTLRKQDQTKLAIEFQSYIAGDLANKN